MIMVEAAHDLLPKALALRLAGQRPLPILLGRPDQMAIGQRLPHDTALRLLSRDEPRAYVVQRGAVVGAQADPFDGDAPTVGATPPSPARPAPRLRDDP